MSHSGGSMKGGSHKKDSDTESFGPFIFPIVFIVVLLGVTAFFGNYTRLASYASALIHF